MKIEDILDPGGKDRAGIATCDRQTAILDAAIEAAEGKRDEELGPRHYPWDDRAEDEVEMRPELSHRPSLEEERWEDEHGGEADLDAMGPRS